MLAPAGALIFLSKKNETVFFTEMDFLYSKRKNLIQKSAYFKISNNTLELYKINLLDLEEFYFTITVSLPENLANKINEKYNLN